MHKKRYILFLLLLLVFYSSYTFSQQNPVIKKYYSFYIDGNSFFSNPYNIFYNSDYYPSPTSSLFAYSFGTNLNIITLKKICFSWDFEYNIAQTKDFIKFEPKPQDVYISSVKIYNLKKIRTGPTFFIGNQQQLELGFNVEYGLLKKTISFNGNTSYGWQGNDVIESRINIGYKHVRPNGLLIRGGFSYNKSILRNTKYHYYGGYLSLGYSFRKTIDIVPKVKKNNFIVLNGMGYLFDFQLNYIGVGLGFEHFIYNTNRVNIGYSMLIKGGIGDYYNLPLNIISSVVLLYGVKEKSKIDLEIGANVPLINLSDAQFYQFINLGVGYRYINDNFSFRIGTSSTGILKGSIGFVIGK